MVKKKGQIFSLRGIYFDILEFTFYRKAKKTLCILSNSSCWCLVSKVKKQTVA